MSEAFSSESSRRMLWRWLTRGGTVFPDATNPQVEVTGVASVNLNAADDEVAVYGAEDGSGTLRVMNVDSSGKLRVVVVPANTFQSASYTGTGSGTTQDITQSPLKYFAIQVKGTGGAPTTWDIRLEGSLDGTNFSQILQHQTTTGDGAVLWGTTTAASRYFRTRVVSLTLGAASAVVVGIFGLG